MNDEPIDEEETEPDPCPACGGTGHGCAGVDPDRMCPYCRGSGVAKGDERNDDDIEV